MKKPIRGTGEGSFPLFHSIRFRLTLWFVSILGLVLLVFSSFIYWAQSRDLESNAVARVQEENARLFSSIQESGSEESHAAPGQLVPLSPASIPAGDLLILVNAGGSITQQWGQEISDPEGLVQRLLPVAGRQVYASPFHDQLRLKSDAGVSVRGDYIIIVTPIRTEGQLLGYLILAGRVDLADQQRRLAVSLAVGSLVMLAFAFLGGMWIADRAMRPVKTITHAAKTITESDLGRRLNIQGRDELADLAATFDGMIARLQAAFDRQRRFVADASHELRTPLTIINLEVERVLEGLRTEAEYKRALHVVDAEGRRMARLVNDLMTLARMDSGLAILHFEGQDLGEIAREAVARMSSLAARRGVHLEAAAATRVPVRGDRQYLLQMVSNLVENGVKYSAAGQQVRVETSSAGGTASLLVSDTGPGIPPEHLPVLFDRFYRVDQSRYQNEDDDTGQAGSGLGLSIVAWIVHAHNGDIRVQSKINEGTTFEVSLPLSRG